MLVIPAIDLRAGRCVRLRQGDYAQETVFGDDPAAMARRWVDEGASYLHLVDLDGAKAGRPVNLPAVADIVRSAGVPCQVGGGLRDEQHLETVFAAGIHRAVIGTKALKEPDWFAAMCRKFPNRLLLGLDARDGWVATEGWLETSQARAVDLARACEKLPLAGVIFTDIGRDGMLSGPNVPALAEMLAATSLPIIASGGVADIADIRRLALLPLAGCIVGRAIYEGTLSLGEALQAAAGGSAQAGNGL